MDEETSKDSDEGFKRILEILRQFRNLKASYNDYNEEQLKSAISDILELARVNYNNNST